MDPAGWTTAERLQFTNWPKIDAQPGLDQVGQLFRPVLHPPSIKIASLLIEAGENQREKVLIRSVAVGRNVGANQTFFSVGKGLLRTIVDRYQVRNITVLPRRGIALGYCATALGKARIAYGAVVEEKFAGGCLDSF